jgi:predicted nucleotide-binding protein
MVVRQEAMIVRQQKATEAFTVQLKEQDAILQKVSAQVQTNKPAPQMAVNP